MGKTLCVLKLKKKYHEFVERINFLQGLIVGPLNFFLDFLALEKFLLIFREVSLWLVEFDRVRFNSFFKFLDLLLKAANLVACFVESAEILIIDVFDIVPVVDKLFPICQVEIHENLFDSELKEGILFLLSHDVRLHDCVSELSMSLNFFKLVLLVVKLAFVQDVTFLDWNLMRCHLSFLLNLLALEVLLRLGLQ